MLTIKDEMINRRFCRKEMYIQISKIHRYVMQNDVHKIEISNSILPENVTAAYLYTKIVDKHKPQETERIDNIKGKKYEVKRNKKYKKSLNQ